MVLTTITSVCGRVKSVGTFGPFVCDLTSEDRRNRDPEESTLWAGQDFPERPAARAPSQRAPFHVLIQSWCDPTDSPNTAHQALSLISHAPRKRQMDDLCRSALHVSSGHEIVDHNCNGPCCGIQ